LSTSPPHTIATVFPYTTLFRSRRTCWRPAYRRRAQTVAPCALCCCPAGVLSLESAAHRPLQTADRRWEGTQARAHRLCQETPHLDRKSTRLNSSHLGISYAVFC